MSFTTDVKKELITLSVAGGKASAYSALSAFVRTSGALGISDGTPTFFLVSETENVAEFFMQLFSESFNAELSVTHATMDRKRGRDKLVMQCPPALAPVVLKRLGLLKREGNGIREGISAKLLNDDEKRIAYIRGAFLGGGSCTLPSGQGSGYHLEIVFSERKTARDFCLLLAEFEVIAKLVERKDTYVAYIKSKELISDFLSVIGAENALKKFTAFVDKRDEANRDNRAKNCFSGNADKSAIAAVKQVVALEKLQKSATYKMLGEELKTLISARLKNPTLSLKELAELLKISKSCLNHRMRKLMETAEEITE